MLPTLRSLLSALLLLASLPAAWAQGPTGFPVRGTTPDGKAYSGTVALRKTGDTFDVQWITGQPRDALIGFGFATETITGIGFGGSALYSVAVYEMKGKTMQGSWAVTGNPGAVGRYELRGGSGFSGVYKFGTGKGTVTFTPGKNGVYKVVWELEKGHFEGIGIRLGETVVAVAGEPGKTFGVAAYRPNGSNLDGIWASTATSGTGKESWGGPGGGEGGAGR